MQVFLRIQKDLPKAVPVPSTDIDARTRKVFSCYPTRVKSSMRESAVTFVFCFIPCCIGAIAAYFGANGLGMAKRPHGVN